MFNRLISLNVLQVGHLPPDVLQSVVGHVQHLLMTVAATLVRLTGRHLRQVDQLLADLALHSLQRLQKAACLTIDDLHVRLVLAELRQTLTGVTQRVHQVVLDLIELTQSIAVVTIHSAHRWLEIFRSLDGSSSWLEFGLRVRLA